MDKERRAAEYYRRAVEAIKQQNWELSVRMFRECAALEPDNVMYRQLLHNSEARLLRNSETKRDGSHGRTS